MRFATRWQVILVIAAVAGVPSSGAAQTWTDVDGRFSMDLASGWQMTNNQMTLYVFNKAGAPALLLNVLPGTASLNDAYSKAVEMFLMPGKHPLPPADSIKDMQVNANQVRAASYPARVMIGEKPYDVLIHLGAMVIEGGDGAVSYFALITDKQMTYRDELVRVTNSIRLPGAPLRAPENVRVATLSLAAPDTASVDFEHALMRLRIPAGWTVTRGTGSIAAKLTHSSYGTLTLMGLPKNGFGPNIAAILAGLQAGLQSSLGSMQASGQPYDFRSDAGAPLRAADFTGVVTAMGKNVPQLVVLAAYKDDARGLGFMAMAPQGAGAAAKEQVLQILRTLR